jgi:hypothetical protein
LRQLRISGSDLLQDRLKHLRLQLYNLSQLLELWVVTQEIQAIAAKRRTSCRSSSTTSASSTTATSASLSSLCSGFKEIYRLVASSGSCGGSRVSAGCSWG